MIPPGSVKICSLREPEHAEHVVAAGADMFGLIFVRDAWRYVEPGKAQAIVRRSRDLAGDAVKAVGVFLRTPVDEVNRIAEETDLDLLQLYYPDLPADLADYERPVIVTLRPGPDESAAQVADKIGKIERMGPNVAGVLLDAFSVTGNGGLGELADWKLAQTVAADHGILLAGGLTPHNVGEAIRTVRPIGVDVSSGVETDKVKDPAKIVAFVQNARAAFAEASIGQVNLRPLS